MDNVGKFYVHWGIVYGYLVYFMAIWCILWLFGVFYGYLVYFMAIWCILWLFGMFYGHFMVIWYIFPRFGILCPEKSGSRICLER
jgi:hypothetical protein